MTDAALVQTNDDEVSMLDISLIDVREGHNPRRFRSTKRLSEMRESIAAKGVLQPILVRPHPDQQDRFEVCAGHTRLELSVDVGHTAIPALIKTISDDEMLTLSSVENIVRADMTPVDEGQAAKQLLIKHNNDQDEVCRLLGWSKTKLLGRVQITHCVDVVAQALVDEEITIGHAQLLSGMREAAQPGGLKLVLKEKLTADELRKRIEAQALRLSGAIFNTDDCQGCPHNSSQQSSLFASSGASGRCLNKDCFSAKTDARLGEMKVELAESYNSVHLDTDIAEGSHAIIATSGSNGVGQAQASACQGCEHYGAMIATKLGNEGKVTEGVCYNTVCNNEKVDAYQSLIATEARDATMGALKSANDEASSQTDSEAASKPESAEKPAKAKGKKPTVASVPKHVLEVNHKVHRQAAKAQASSESKIVTIMAVLALMSDTGQGFKKAPEGWPVSLGGAYRGVAFGILDQLDEAKLLELLKGLTEKALLAGKSNCGGENEKDTFGSVANYITKSRKADLSNHFVMDSSYLGKHTKPVIESLLAGSGFNTAYDKTNGDGEFKKLMGGKKDDILKAVEKSEYDFSGFIPDSMVLA